MSCEACGGTPGPGDELPFAAREDLFSESHEGLALCRCRECGRPFARYWWELIDWERGEDEIRRYWVPLRGSEEDDLRARRIGLPELVTSRRHLLQEADGTFCWTPAGGPYLPSLLPPGSPVRR